MNAMLGRETDPQLEALYQEVILDHYRHPQGRGLREPFDAEVHHVNPVCGDEITLRLALGTAGEGAGEQEVNLSFEAQGCSISQAAASVMFEQVDGVPLDQALAVGDQFRELMDSATREVNVDEDTLGDGIAFAGVARYPARVKCALLPWMALRDAAARVVRPEVTEGDRE